jgi:hypothetical protein
MYAAEVHLNKICMAYSEIEITELKKICPDLSEADEGGHSYILIKQLRLPDGCIPSACDALLCPAPRDGYESRLFFSVQISGCPSRNWNGQLRVLNQNWYAFSWAVPGGIRLAEILLVHLKGLRP